MEIAPLRRTSLLVIAATILAAGSPSPSRAGGLFLHKDKVLVFGGGGLVPGLTPGLGVGPGVGLGPVGPTPGFSPGMSSFGLSSGGFGLATAPVYSVAGPVAVGSYGLASVPVRSAVSTPVMVSGVSMSGAGSGMAFGGMDAEAAQEYRNFLNHRAGILASGGAGLAASSELQLASEPQFQTLAAAVGGPQELAGIGSYLRQFATRTDIVRHGLNLFRAFAYYNPWFNLNQYPFLQEPFDQFLDRLGGGRGGFSPGFGRAEEPPSADGLDQAVDRLNEAVTRLEGVIRDIPSGGDDADAGEVPGAPPAGPSETLEVGDRIKAVADHGAITVSRDGKEVEIDTRGKLFQPGDVIQEVVGDGSYRFKRGDRRYLYNSGNDGTPDERLIEVGRDGRPLPPAS